MSTAYRYRPKFVDVRVHKPAGEPPPREPGERGCEQVGCARAGVHRAPKGWRHEGDYWWFCADHAAEYNRTFNYFAGMNDEQLMAYAAREAVGHRPTWRFRAGAGDRLDASARSFRGGRRKDPFEMFGPDNDPRVDARRPAVGRVQSAALEALGLDGAARPEDVRARYAELVKRLHPDSNGGDRSSEAHLQRVIRAFQTLKRAKFC